jgi:hypothetical protein
MAKTEVGRLKELLQAAVADPSISHHPAVQTYTSKVAKYFIPSDEHRLRDAINIIWWVAAVQEYQAALGIADVLCQIDRTWRIDTEDDIASIFAARAWLHRRSKQTKLAKADAASAWGWYQRSRFFPQFKVADRVSYQQEQFHEWMKRADEARTPQDKATVLSFTIRMWSLYAQLALAGVKEAQKIPARTYAADTRRGLEKLRQRISEIPT